jgi:hypothetical protein
MAADSTVEDLAATPDMSRAFFYDVAELPLQHTVDLYNMLEGDAKERFFKTFGDGSGIHGKVICSTDVLSISLVIADPGAHVGRHRHGKTQVTFMLKGELKYGARVVTAGMGLYTPDRPYTWTAGPEGAEFIEIHSGVPGMIIGGVDISMNAAPMPT